MAICFQIHNIIIQLVYLIHIFNHITSQIYQNHLWTPSEKETEKGWEEDT